MPWQAVIVSCDYRRDARARTAASLLQHGVRPALITTLCQPAVPRNLRRAAVLAMTRAAQAGSDLLWLEDDVRADDRLLPALALCEQQQHVVSLCVMEPDCEPDSVRAARTAGQPMPLHLAQLPNTRLWWGSQALYVPRAAMRPLLTHPMMLADRESHSFDTALPAIWHELGLPLYGVFPNPVQHMNEPSARKVTRGLANRKPRTSPTYGWPLEATDAVPAG